MPRFAITTPIFYVNGPPHIGHAYTIVAADVLARARRLRGDDPTAPRFTRGSRGAGVFFLTGTDERGTKIFEAAAAAGKEPQQFADEVAGKFRDAWKALDIQYDDFIRTTEPRHVQGVQHALRKLHEGGYLYEKSYRGLYCTGCENFLTEKDLDADGKCPLHNRQPELLEEKNWFFKLSLFLDEVRSRIERDKLKISPPERKNEVLGLLRGSVIARSPAAAGRRGNPITSGVADFSISRPKSRVPWAIPLPFDETHTCYVWVDALLNYVTALGYGSPENSKLEAEGSPLKKYWPADLQLIGLDILKFHAVYWPAILLALELPLPKEIFVHGFFTVNGQKISKSLGNVIDPLALVRRYGSDATRYLLLSQFPFGASGDVNGARCDEQYDAVLANTIGNLVSRTIALLHKFSDGKIPDAPPDTSVIASEAKQFLSSPRTRGPVEDVIARSRRDEATSSSIAADLDGIVSGPVRLAQELNQYADRTAPWKETDPAKRAVALRTLADGVVRLALLAEPLLPRASAAIQCAFGGTDRQASAPGTLRLSRVARGRSGIRPTNPPILFPRTSVSERGERS